MQHRMMSNTKLSLATLAFVASVGSLIVGTLAWFSSSSFLEISRFYLTMGEAEQVEIGLEVPGNMPSLGAPGDIVYYDSVDDAVLMNHGYYNPWMLFKPVSSMYQSLWLGEDTDLSDPGVIPQFRSQYIYGSNIRESQLAEDYFYQFEFYFRSNVRIDLFMDQGSYLVADETRNREAARINNLDVDDLNKVSRAMRVSFMTPDQYLIWEPDTDDAGITEFGGRLDIGHFDHTYDYDPITKQEQLFGEYNGDEHLVYDEGARVTSVTGKYSSFNALTHQDAVPLDIPASKANGLVIATETSYDTSYMTDFENDGARLLRLYPNVPQRLVVSVYIEGWDRDTTNSLNFASFALNIVFGGQYAPL